MDVNITIFLNMDSSDFETKVLSSFLELFDMRGKDFDEALRYLSFSKTN